MNEIKELKPESVINHLLAMTKTEGWSILLFYWNQRREAIIEEGKKSRADNKQIQIWSKLQGFDSAVLLLESIIKQNEVALQMDDDKREYDTQDA